MNDPSSSNEVFSAIGNDGPEINDDLLEGYITYEIALGLLFSALVLDALFGGIRKIATLGIPTLQVIVVFTLGQFIFFLILWGVVGSDLVSQGYGYEVMFAILAGINVQIAEYLFTIASKFLKSAIATACVSIEFIFSSFILYALLPSGISLEFLGIGLLLISLGIISNLMPLFINGYRNAQARKAALVDRAVVTVAHNLAREDFDEDDEGNQFESSMGRRKRSLSNASISSLRSSGNAVSDSPIDPPTPVRRAKESPRGLHRRRGSKGAPGDNDELGEGGGATLRDDDEAGDERCDDEAGDERCDGGEGDEETLLLDKSKRTLRFSESTMGADPERGGGNEAAAVTEEALAEYDAACQQDAESKQPQHNVFWVIVALSAGLLMSSWAILTSLATLGDGGISHTADLLFIFSCGQVLALPILVILFGYWDIIGMRTPLEPPFRLREFIGEMGKMPGYQHLIIIALSLVKDGYEAGYFYVLGSGEIPRAVIYATLSSIAPIATIASLVVFREYDDENFFSLFYLFTFISFIFFALGVFVVIEYAFDDALADDYEFQR